MNEHESVRALLPLGAAGLLGPDEIRSVEQHARACEACRKDLDTWSAYAEGLRKLPQPSAPDGLVERTRARDPAVVARAWRGDGVATSRASPGAERFV